MSAEDFCGDWKVIAGATPRDKTLYHSHIEKPIGQAENAYRIAYSANGRRGDFEQTLYFDEATHTLRSRPDDGKPQRCVALWRGAKGEKSCVFAMWIGKGGDEAGLPWEAGDNGSWGAEAG